MLSIKKLLDEAKILVFACKPDNLKQKNAIQPIGAKENEKYKTTN